jgi:tRNA nucleotidyltransferase (CCA-adding enzyme)
MKAREPSRAFNVMLRTGILDVTCPELVTTHGCQQNRWHVFDVWGHSMACLDACEGDPILRIAALLHDIGKPRSRAFSDKTDDYTFHEHERIGAEIAEPILQRLRFSNDDRHRIVHLVRHHLVCYEPSWTDSAVRRWIRRVTRERMDDLYALCRADVLGKGRPAPDEIERVEQLRARAARILEAGDALSTKALVLNGNDLMRELDLRPGRHIGQLLDALLEKVIDDPSLNTREQLLALARSQLTAEA